MTTESANPRGLGPTKRLAGDAGMAKLAPRPAAYSSLRLRFKYFNGISATGQRRRGKSGGSLLTQAAVGPCGRTFKFHQRRLSRIYTISTGAAWANRYAVS